MADRLKRRKKPAEQATSEPKATPLQPAYFDATPAAPPVAEPEDRQRHIGLRRRKWLNLKCRPNLPNLNLVLSVFREIAAQAAAILRGAVAAEVAVAADGLGPRRLRAKVLLIPPPNPPCLSRHPPLMLRKAL